MRLPGETALDEVWVILGAKAVAFGKNFTDFRTHNVLKQVSTAIIYTCIAGGMFLLARRFSSFLIDYVGVGVEPLHGLLVVFLFAFFCSLVFMSLVLSYATLFTSREVEFLQGLPVSARNLFLLRAGENFTSSSNVLLLIGSAGVLGYTSVFRLSWYGYIAVVGGVMLPLSAIAGVLGTLVLMGFILLAGRIGVRWMILAASVLCAAYVALTYWLTDPEGILNAAIASSQGGDFSTLRVETRGVLWLPHGIAASALRHIVRGEIADGLRSIAGLFGMLGVLIAVALCAGARVYHSAWLLLGELRTSSGASRPRTWVLWDLRRQWTKRPNVEAVVKRDVLQFIRDPVQCIHALVMAALVVATMVFGKMSILPTMQSIPGALGVVTVVLFDSFLIASITLRFVFPAFSLEGNAFWCVRAAPISVARLYWMKFLTWLPVILLPAEVLVWTTLPMAHAPRRVTFVCEAMMLCNVIGLVSLNLGAGAYFATTREENPVKVASSQGASMTFLVSVVYLIATGVVVLIPIAEDMNGSMIAPPSTMLTIALVIVAGISCTVGAIGHFVGIIALRKDF